MKMRTKKKVVYKFTHLDEWNAMIDSEFITLLILYVASTSMICIVLLSNIIMHSLFLSQPNQGRRKRKQRNNTRKITITIITTTIFPSKKKRKKMESKQMTKRR